MYKIGDLGLMSDAMSSKIFMEGDCRYCEQGCCLFVLTLCRYLSRELLEDDMSCPRQSDIFSVGASIYELV